MDDRSTDDFWFSKVQVDLELPNEASPFLLKFSIQFCESSVSNNSNLMVRIEFSHKNFADLFIFINE